MADLNGDGVDNLATGSCRSPSYGLTYDGVAVYNGPATAARPGDDMDAWIEDSTVDIGAVKDPLVSGDVDADGQADLVLGSTEAGVEAEEAGVVPPNRAWPPHPFDLGIPGIRWTHEPPHQPR